MEDDPRDHNQQQHLYNQGFTSKNSLSFSRPKLFYLDYLLRYIQDKNDGKEATCMPPYMLFEGLSLPVTCSFAMANCFHNMLARALSFFSLFYYSFVVY